jgi:truncated hemoglobin YjbI
MIKFIRLIDTKAREKKINQLWHEYQNIEKNPELMKIFARTVSGLEASLVSSITSFMNLRNEIRTMIISSVSKSLKP